MSEAKLHPGLNLGNSHGADHTANEKPLFGFWVFMMSDFILFGLCFATYGLMWHQGIAGGPGPKELFELKSPLIETLLLLTSSFTYGMASLAMKYDERLRPLLVWLGITFLLGAGFIGFEIFDHMKLIQKGATPDRSGFLSILWTLVPLHGLHVSVGLIWMGVLMVQIIRFGRHNIIKLRLLQLGLFWHMLDIIWIAIFSLVFLAGQA